MDIVFMFLDNTTFEVGFDELDSVEENDSYYGVRFTDGSVVQLMKTSMKHLFVEDSETFVSEYLKRGV